MGLVFYEVKHIFFDCLNESEVYRSQNKKQKRPEEKDLWSRRPFDGL